MGEQPLPALAGPEFANLRAALAGLSSSPPHSLLLEGGSEESRRQAALFWAMACNCKNGQGGQPCLACPVCRQIESLEYLDLMLYDGRISNSQDESDPGPVRALTADNMRELKRSLRDSVRGSGRRVVVLMGLGPNRGSAANALLKSLEEPPENTVFTLLAPQREQLLPTLVSRSFCLTLPWPDSSRPDPQDAPWESLLAAFVDGESGFLEKTAGRGAMDAPTAASILLALQKALARAIRGERDDPLSGALARLGPAEHLFLFQRIGLAQDMLDVGVTPARVLEGVAVRLWQAADAAHGRPRAQTTGKP